MPVFRPLTPSEALEACIEYTEHDSVFDAQARVYRYAKTGWGNPRILYNALHDGYDGLQPVANHSFKGRPLNFKIRLLCDAIRAGAFRIEGIPLANLKQVKPIRLDPRIAAHLNFDFANESGAVGGETYADLRLTPVEALGQCKQGGGRPSRTSELEKLHEENQRLAANCPSQTAYAEILKKAATRKRIDVSLKTIQRFLTMRGVLTKKQF